MPEKLPHVRILVSSKILMLTSMVFRRMLSSESKEVRPVPDRPGRRMLKIRDSEPFYVLELCKVLHHAIGDWGSKYPLYYLAGVGIQAAKYEAQNAVFDVFTPEMGYYLNVNADAQLTGFAKAIPGRCLMIMRIAFLVGNHTWFKIASRIYAHVEKLEEISSQLHLIFGKSGIKVWKTLARTLNVFMIGSDNADTE